MIFSWGVQGLCSGNVCRELCNEHGTDLQLKEEAAEQGFLEGLL